MTIAKGSQAFSYGARLNALRRITTILEIGKGLSPRRVRSFEAHRQPALVGVPSTDYQVAGSTSGLARPVRWVAKSMVAEGPARLNGVRLLL